MGKNTPKSPKWNGKKETNKERRAKMNQPMVLVGFGSRDLVDLVKFLGTDDEERAVTEPFEKGWPPRFKRVGICSEEEVEAFRTFTNFMTNVIAQ